MRHRLRAGQSLRWRFWFGTQETTTKSLNQGPKAGATPCKSRLQKGQAVPPLEGWDRFFCLAGAWSNQAQTPSEETSPSSCCRQKKKTPKPPPYTHKPLSAPPKITFIFHLIEPCLFITITVGKGEDLDSVLAFFPHNSPRSRLIYPTFRMWDPKKSVFWQWKRSYLQFC